MPTPPSQKNSFRPGSKELHDRIRDDILIALGSTQMCRVWPNETGAAYRDGKLIHYGLVGSADITGILSNGQRLEIEVKSGRAVQTKEQIAFQKMIEKFGGIYILASSVDDVLSILSGGVLQTLASDDCLSPQTLTIKMEHQPCTK